jgi:sarcosine/dimethylglycine N-methyltransferase
MGSTSPADQYTLGDLQVRIAGALRAAGKDLDALTPADVAPFEHFHSLGILGTIGLLSLAGVRAGERVLDAGAGVGGTARLLAAQHDCDVVAVDVTPEYCEVARWLDGLVGLDAKIDVIEGDVTRLPLPDASFDLVVSQHVQMNIADKAALYAEARRVLRPGGRLALWDVTAGPVQPIRLPVPWADTPDRSHLATPGELRELLAAAGLTTTAFNDLTDFAVQAMTPVFDAPPDPLGLQLVVPDIAEKGRAILTNANENRLRLVQAVAVAA